MSEDRTTRLFEDIQNQPAQLIRSLSYAVGDGAEAIARAAGILRRARTVVIAGIGASWHAGMAVQAMFLEGGIAAVLTDASELLYSGRLPQDLAVVMLSRSGASVEVLKLAERCRAASCPIIAITNNTQSPLAMNADVVLYTSTDFDHAVSVSTYSSIALQGALLAWNVAGSLSASLAGLLARAISSAGDMIPDWQRTIEKSGWLGDGRQSPYFLARGASGATCHEARLLWEEAAKLPATALTTGGFRHGPQEIVREGFRVGLWVDAERMRRQDLTLASDLRAIGASVLLVGQDLEDGLEEGAGDCVLRLPEIPARWQFLIDAMPIQIAAESLARMRGEDCDSFRLCSYIVEEEGGLSPKPREAN